MLFPGRTHIPGNHHHSYALSVVATIQHQHPGFNFNDLTLGGIIECPGPDIPRRPMIL